MLEERSRFPTALEIIVGKFPRHTSEYYQWRLDDRLEKLKDKPGDNLLLDDVAVSYEKLKRYDEAIKVAQTQLEQSPDRYESLANLGTFLIHNGQLKEGLAYIEKAIEVNPDAHFGREKYQVILVKYILLRMKNGEVTLPLAQERFQDSGPDARISIYEHPFRKFLKQELIGDDRKRYLKSEQIEEATTGILGMMRFSRHQSPILLEVLGELSEGMSARQIAYRAYTSAAQQVDNARSKQQYEELASNALNWSLFSWEEQNGVTIIESEIASDFLAEQADGKKWFEALAKDERDWIAAGEAVDVKFNEKYRDVPAVIATDRDTEREPQDYPSSGSMLSELNQYLLVCATLGLAIGGTLVVAWNRHRKTRSA